MIFTAYMSKSAHTYFGYCEIDNNYGISAAVDFGCRYMFPANWLLLPSSKCERGGAGVDRNPYQIIIIIWQDQIKSTATIRKP